MRPQHKSQSNPTPQRPLLHWPCPLALPQAVGIALGCGVNGNRKSIDRPLWLVGWWGGMDVHTHRMDTQAGPGWVDTRQHSIETIHPSNQRPTNATQDLQASHSVEIEVGSGVNGPPGPPNQAEACDPWAKCLCDGSSTASAATCRPLGWMGSAAKPPKMRLHPHTGGGY